MDLIAELQVDGKGTWRRWESELVRRERAGVGTGEVAGEMLFWEEGVGGEVEGREGSVDDGVRVSDRESEGVGECLFGLVMGEEELELDRGLVEGNIDKDKSLGRGLGLVKEIWDKLSFAESWGEDRMVNEPKPETGEMCTVVGDVETVEIVRGRIWAGLGDEGWGEEEWSQEEG